MVRSHLGIEVMVSLYLIDGNKQTSVYMDLPDDPRWSQHILEGSRFEIRLAQLDDERIHMLVTCLGLPAVRWILGTLLVLAFICQIYLLVTFPDYLVAWYAEEHHSTMGTVWFIIRLSLSCLLTLSPGILLVAMLFRNMDENIFKVLLRRYGYGITVEQLAPARHWVFFPFDVTIIQLTAFIVFGILLVRVTGPSIYFLFLPPLIGVVIVFLPLLLSELTHHHLRQRPTLQDHQKRRAADTIYLPILLFVSPLFVYWLLWLSERLTFASLWFSVNPSYLPGFPGDNQLANDRATLALAAWRDLEHAYPNPAVAVVRVGRPEHTPFTSPVEWISANGGPSPLVHLVLTIPSFVIVVFIVIFMFQLLRNTRLPIASQALYRPITVLSSTSALVSPNNRSHVAFFSTMALLSIILLAAAFLTSITIVLWILWLLDRGPSTWQIPFEWYVYSNVSLLGPLIGTALTHLLLLLLFLPATVWATLWLASITLAFLRSIRTFIYSRHTSTGDRAMIVQRVTRLSCKLNIPSPRIYWDTDSARPPEALAILPTARFALIRLSPAFISQLSAAQLDIVLAHELGHLALHTRRLWGVRLLSRLSLVGPGYLPLLLDFPKMELEADQYAYSVANDQLIWRHLLEQLEIIELRAWAELSQHRQARPSSRLVTLWRRCSQNHRSPDMRGNIFRLYFSDQAWGYFYPSNAERIVQVSAAR